MSRIPARAINRANAMADIRTLLNNNQKSFVGPESVRVLKAMREALREAKAWRARATDIQGNDPFPNVDGLDDVVAVYAATGDDRFRMTKRRLMAMRDFIDQHILILEDTAVDRLAKGREQAFWVFVVQAVPLAEQDNHTLRSWQLQLMRDAGTVGLQLNARPRLNLLQSEGIISTKGGAQPQGVTLVEGPMSLPEIKQHIVDNLAAWEADL